MERYTCKYINRLDIANMLFLPKLIYRVNAIPVNIADGFSVQIDKHFRIHIEIQRTKNS